MVKMKRSIVVLTLFLAAAVALFEIDIPNDDEDDRWVWGIADRLVDPNSDTEQNMIEILETTLETIPTIETKTTAQINVTTATMTTTETIIKPENISACNYRPPERPNFKEPGRKISDEKCEEYKWKERLEVIIASKRRDCFRERNNGRLPPPQTTVGGRLTFQGEFPHMGAIGWLATVGGYLFKCGSTLISHKFILTAAHCSKASAGDPTLADVVPKIVRLSGVRVSLSDDVWQNSEDHNIIRIIVHPEYKPLKKYYDIALMELENEVTFSWTLKPACLWTKPDISSLGPEATLTGWGVSSAGSTEISLDLQAADVDIINSTYCDTLLHNSYNRHWKRLHEHQLCAGKLAGGVDACQGDSGGPLQVKENLLGTFTKFVYHVIGVTSFGIGCALPNSPGIYTRVSSFTDWIEGHVWP